jgi:hypothetical protein
MGISLTAVRTALLCCLLAASQCDSTAPLHPNQGGDSGGPKQMGAELRSVDDVALKCVLGVSLSWASLLDRIDRTRPTACLSCRIFCVLISERGWQGWAVWFGSGLEEGPSCRRYLPWRAGGRQMS